MSNKTVSFFPNCEKYKTPTGAATVGEPISLTLKFTRPQNPSEVFLVLTKRGEDPVRYAMTLTKDDEGEYTYTITVKVTTSGLYFYHFDILSDDQTYRVGSDDVCARGDGRRRDVRDHARQVLYRRGAQQDQELCDLPRRLGRRARVPRRCRR